MPGLQDAFIVKPKQEDSNLTQRQRLWGMAFAYQSFGLAYAGFTALNSPAIGADKHLKGVILCGAVVAYARPFKQQREWARLPILVVPERYRDIHNVLIVTRDKMFAHTDAKGLLASEGEFNSIRYCVERGKATMRVPNFGLTEEALVSICELSRILITKAEYHTQKLQNQLLKRLQYPDGVYELSLTEGGDILVPT
jgi:hypothetical protein